MANIMKTAGISSKACHSQALDISDTGVISVCTTDGVDLFDIGELPFQQVEQPSYRQNRIKSLEKPHVVDVEIQGEKVTRHKDHVANGALMEILLDHDLTGCGNRTPNPYVGSVHDGYRLAKWSPTGLDTVGRSVLATLTRDYRLSLYSLGQSTYTWKEVCRLSRVLADHFKETNFSMEGTLNEPDEKLLQYKHRIDCVTATELCWCPNLFESEDSDSEPKVKRPKVLPSSNCKKEHKFARLATSVRSCHVVFWQIDVPLQNSGVRVEKIVYLGQGCYGSSMLWCPGEKSDPGRLVVGCDNGQILVIRLSDYTVTELWEDKDRIAVTNLIYQKQKHILLASKGVYVVCLLLDQSDNFKVLKKGTQSVNNVYPVTAMAAAVDKVYVATADGSVLYHEADLDKDFKLCLQPLTIARTGITLVKNHGVALSKNNSLLCVLESPSASFCHLSLKAPLKLHILADCTPDDVYQTLITQEYGSLGSVSDVLVCLKYHLSQEQQWPDHIQQYVDVLKNETLLKTRTTFQLKLLRYFVQLKILFQEKTASDPEKDSSQSALSQLEEIILSRHIVTTLQTFLESHQQDNLSENDTTSLYLMRRFMETVCTKYLEEETVNKISHQLQGKGVAADSPEGCKVCQKNMCSESMVKSTCENGHSFGRCVQTLLSCQIVPYRKCYWCGVVALHKIPGNSSTSWLEELQTDTCPLCDHKLLYS